MAEVCITINGRPYEIGCDPGQEGRVVDIAAYVDSKLQQIARAGAAYNDAHLLVLTALVVADELFELREAGGDAKPAKRAAAPAAPAAENGLSREDEAALAKVIEGIAKRIDGIATKVSAA
jgi:cell division protein ZapA